MVKRFMLDCGNSDIKSAISISGGDEVRTDIFPHVLVQLRKSDYEKILARNDPKAMQDIYVVNDVAYQIGKSAERRDFKVIKKGAARYQADYYGVIAAIAMARCFKKSANDIAMVGSHPPRDVQYVRNIANAVMAYAWEVGYQGKTYTFTVQEFYAADEPTCGYMNKVLRKDSRYVADKRILDSETLVIDIGGFTTDIIIFDKGGKPDVASANSQELGVLKAVQGFEDDFRRANSELMRGKKLSIQQVHDAFRTGKMDLKGLANEPIDCSDIVYEYSMELVNAVVGFYEEYGGSAAYDTVLLTGGGSALLYDYLIKGLNHNNVLLSGKRETLQLANSEGGLKWLEMMLNL